MWLNLVVRLRKRFSFLPSPSKLIRALKSAFATVDRAWICPTGLSLLYMCSICHFQVARYLQFAQARTKVSDYILRGPSLLLQKRPFTENGHLLGSYDV